MNIDINEKEARVLLVALHAYRSYLHNEAEELAAIEAARMKRKTYPPPLEHCYCCLDMPEKKVEIPYYKDNEFCVQLRDKLKMHQMKFPSEEHKYKKYDYGKEFGYENPKWTKTTIGPSGGMMQREPDVEP